MSTQAYLDWLAAGRPWRMAVPVAEYRAAFLTAGWPPGSLGTIGDDAHLTSDHPQDHTPFSVTGWPDPNPRPYVLALDAGHDPAHGRDMAAVVSHWLADARSGRTPWVKYIVWRGALYDVRSGWSSQGASDHYDHAHISFRTDWYNRSIGGYNVIPTGGAVGTQITSLDIQKALQAAGYDPGPLDDDWGTRSQAALVVAFRARGVPGEPGKDGKDGAPGKDGRTPTVVRLAQDGAVIAWADSGTPAP